MSYSPDTPFDSIEGAHQYIDLLLEAIEETQNEVGAEIEVSGRNGADRRQQALRMVAHNLGRLSFHVVRSRRILNDLRTLRRLLLEERQKTESRATAKAAGAD